MGQGSSRIFNIIAIVFLVLSVLWIIYVVVALLGPPAVSQSAADLPAVMSFPTLPPTPTGLPTNTPTDTLTPTTTHTPTDTPPPSATTAPSATITFTPSITPTPSNTPTPPASNTPVPTATPTGPTETFTPTTSPFPFALREGQIIFTQNFANSAGCAWQGIGGQVFDLNGTPLPGFQVHVFGANNFDRFTQSGSNTLYGGAGWEMPVDNVISANTYFVELVSPQGTAISPRVEVTFPQDCAQNLALVNFVQTRPL